MDEQWERIRSHFPEEHIADGRPGRKPIPTRRVLEAVLWLLNTNAAAKLSQLQNGTSALSAYCRDEILRALGTYKRVRGFSGSNSDLADCVHHVLAL